MGQDFFSIKYFDNQFIYIDQTQLPLLEEYFTTDNYEVIAVAIEKLGIRGAPAIGISAAYAIALAFKKHNYIDNEYFENVTKRLASTRPTAVNLFWAIDQMKKVYYSLLESDNVFDKLIKTAIEIHNDDIEKCNLLANNGLGIFSKKSNVLTHCNTGKLATGGEGTALAVIKAAYKKNLVELVYVDETRPLLQGGRLTTFELRKEEIPFCMITDSMAGFVMKQNKVDLVIVGADRIAVNGDAANKVGSYSLAVLCNFHNIPFYIAAPETTIDKNCKSESEIPIEERNKFEMNRIQNIKFTKSIYPVYNPSFDLIPNNLITGIITDKGLFKAPYNFNV